MRAPRRSRSREDQRALTHEERRLEEARHRSAHWKRWGPYLSERAWGTVREDYSPYGTAWDHFPHDHARSKAYRWGEDGIGGICNRHQAICFALALWNGRDLIIKERLFGLTGHEGNHGEDVKEYYFYLDSTPTHSYMKFLYKYPQRTYPYARLVEENRRRGRQALEYELFDTGVFDEDRYFIASAAMVARKPQGLSHVEAASVPVVAVTAWQMLFDYAQAKPGQSLLIHGAAGNVGAYAVQLASQAGLQVFATASSEDAPSVRSLGATTVIDYKTTRFDEVVPPIDVVIDTVGGDTRERSFGIIKPGGMLVSVVSEPMSERHQSNGVQGVFFLVEVTTARLDTITDLFDRGKLTARVGTVLPLAQARTAHEMLGGRASQPGQDRLDPGGSRIRLPSSQELPVVERGYACLPNPSINCWMPCCPGGCNCHARATDGTGVS
jgi:Zinc-binding dehydrogenase